MLKISFNKLLIPIIGLKLIILALFSSDFVHQLFIPFITYYLNNFGNPWDFFHAHQSLQVEFPYNPLMLYIFSFFYLPVHLFSINTLALQNFFFKLPIFLADSIIMYLLCKEYASHFNKILIFYFCSPIILYACYFHSQLDLIPTALLFICIYFLKKKKLALSSLFLGFSLATKFHIAAAIPLIAIYLFKNNTFKKTFAFTVTSLSVYLLIASPYLLSTGFYHLVLHHPKQMMLFDFFISLGPLNIYLPILALVIVYGRFIAYSKINNDLLDAFLAITFSCLVFLIPPAPGWYVWMHPFLSVLFIKYYRLNPFFASLYGALVTTYCLFFILFYESGRQDLLFLFMPISFAIKQAKLTNIIFTFLETSILLIIYFLYKFGVKSNAVYSRQQALIIGVSGDSGSGKTTFMNNLKNILGTKATILEGDGDHKWERGNSNWQQLTHLDPKANFLHRQAEDIFMLKQGLAIDRVNYNHATGKFDLPIRIIPNDVIILAGLHPLYLPKMRKLIDLRIFIDPDIKLQLHWKITRDMHQRGHSLEKILHQINHRKQDRTKHIDPQKEFADIIISYFTKDSFEIGNPNSNPSIKVKILLDSSITLDPLIKNLLKENIKIEWDYANDLQHQYIIIHEELTAVQLANISQVTLVNIEEITAEKIKWQNGNHGFVQLITLITLSEKMKEQNSPWQKNTQSYSTWTTPSTTITPPTMQL